LHAIESLAVWNRTYSIAPRISQNFESNNEHVGTAASAVRPALSAAEGQCQLSNLLIGTSCSLTSRWPRTLAPG